MVLNVVYEVLRVCMQSLNFVVPHVTLTCERTDWYRLIIVQVRR